MNDLILQDLKKQFPAVIDQLLQAQRVLNSIKSFENIERIFLRGQGLSPYTYSNYLQAVKQFYQFTRGLSPLQVTAAHIEQWYDFLKVDVNHKYLKIRGLKKFFSGVKAQFSFFENPFDTMSKKLHRKLNKTKKGNRTKKALSVNEVKQLLACLQKDKALMGKENYAITFMLLTSGIRSCELTQLK